MAFQSTVNQLLAFAVVGELLRDGPTRASSLIVNSSGAANTIGYAFTKSNSTNIASVGGTIASGTVWAGILANPKVYASNGTTAGTLTPTLNIPDNAQASFVYEGLIAVVSTNGGNIGDLLVYDTTTGAISTVAAGSGSAGTGKAFVPGPSNSGNVATVSDYPQTGSGLIAALL